MEKACIKCSRLIDVPDKKKSKKGVVDEPVEEPVCMYCRDSGFSGELTDEWTGIVIILDPKKSEIAAKMGVEVADKFALKVR